MVTLENLVILMKRADIDFEISSSDLEKEFSDIGLDSLDTFNFFIEVNDEYGVMIPDEDFDSVNSLSKTIDYINEKKFRS